MTSLRFSAFFRGASLLLLLSAGAVPAFSADDLPPPSSGTLDELPSSPGPSPQESLDELSGGGDLPSPTLGEESALPEPTGGPIESSKNQVNPAETPDNIYLPNPSGGGNIDYAPVYSNSISPYVNPDSEWKSGMMGRPIFSLNGGIALRNYATSLVEGTTNGYAVAASARVFDLGQTAFLHGLVGASFFDVGDVGPGPAGPSYGSVKDRTYHVGLMGEIGIGRRLSLFGTIMRRWNDVSFDAPSGTDAQKQAVLNQRNPRMLEYIGEKPGIKLGIGGQLDFYVIPHGSIGVQARIEKDYYYLGLAMALEPAPKKKMNLNFESFR